MNIATIFAASTLAAALAIPAAAQDLKPIQSRHIDLGRVAGDAYYTVERDGYRIVATFAERGEAGTPVRFEAVLAPGQSVIVSSPHAVGEPASAVEISRRNDQVVVQPADAID